MFVACGLNHKTAPLSVREKFAQPITMQDAQLLRLVGLPAINEAIILSTCNRTEIYCKTDDPTCLIPWLAQEHQLQPQDISPYFYIHHGDNAIRHGLQVASGLDSMMIGEPQILGQMKTAYQQASQIGAVKHGLRHVFPYIFRASKRIRNKSGVGENPVSVAYAAVQLIGQLLPNYAALNVFLIGSGETSSLVAKYLHQNGVTKFMVASRTREHAEHLAMPYNGDALTISDIPHHLSRADIVISATACPLPFISKSLVEHALTHRNNAPMVFLDLSVPRDIEADVGDLDNVYLYNIDDLQLITEKGMDARRAAANRAEQLIDIELNNYIRWHRSLRAKEVICDYRTNMHTLAAYELQRALQKISAGQCQHSVMTEFSHRLVNKLTHMPTVGLRRAARDDRGDLLDLAHYFFNHSVDHAIS